MQFFLARNRSIVRGALTRAGAPALALCVALLFMLPPRNGEAQQFVVDDADLVERNACQLDGWHGTGASWLLPACHLLPGVEIMAGIGSVVLGGARHTEYVVQGKTLLRGAGTHPVSIGLVGGLGLDPLSQARGGVEGVFAYVPATLALRDEGLLLHANLGWHFERDAHEHAGGEFHQEAHHALTWGLRGDVQFSSRITVIGEIFGEDRLMPEFQVGLRTALVPERLLVDLSWGDHIQRGMRGAGWVLGVAWTPPPLF
jgi:hypothetical protein